MIAAIKILHLAALMFGAAASLGNLYILLAKGPHDLPAPGFVNQLRFLFRITALGAIVFIFLTGAILMISNYGIWIDGFAFSAKMVFAVVLLLIIAFLNLLAMKTATPHKAPPSYVPILHMIALPCLFLAMVFAVIAFN